MKPYIIGVGRRGAEIVQKHLEAGVKDIPVLFADTDRDDLALRSEARRLRLGTDIPPEDVVRNDISFSYNAAMQDEAEIKSRLSDAGIVFLVAGLGGGTGAGGSAALARICGELGVPVLSFVTKPFRIEGESRVNRGRLGFRKLDKAADLTVSFAQDVIVPYAQRATRVRELMDIVDEFVVIAVQTLTQLARNGHSESTFRSFIADHPDGVFGYGLSHDPEGVEEALTLALESPFIKSISLSRSKGVAMTVQGSKPLENEKLMSVLEQIVKSKCPGAITIAHQVQEDGLDGLQISLFLSGEFGEPTPLPMETFTPIYEG